MYNKYFHGQDQKTNNSRTCVLWSKRSRKKKSVSMNKFECKMKRKITTHLTTIVCCVCLHDHWQNWSNLGFADVHIFLLPLFCNALIHWLDFRFIRSSTTLTYFFVKKKAKKRKQRKKDKKQSIQWTKLNLYVRLNIDINILMVSNQNNH